MVDIYKTSVKTDIVDPFVTSSGTLSRLLKNWAYVTFIAYRFKCVKRMVLMLFWHGKMKANLTYSSHFTYHRSHSPFASKRRVLTCGANRSWNACTNWECNWKAADAQAHTPLVGVIANGSLCDSLRREKTHICINACQLWLQMYLLLESRRWRCVCGGAFILFEIKINSSTSA